MSRGKKRKRKRKKRIDSFSPSFSTRDQAVFKQRPLIAIPGARSQASLKKYGSHGRPVVTSEREREI